MFSGIKAYAAGIGLVVVLAVLGYLLYTYDSTKKENTSLQKEVTTTKIENSDLKETVDLTQKSGEITTEAVTHHAQEGKKVDQSFDGIAQREDEQIAEIKRKKPVPAVPPAQPPASSPVSQPTAEAPVAPTVPTVQEAQISAVRINALWQGYCVAAPQAPSCKKE